MELVKTRQLDLCVFAILATEAGIAALNCAQVGTVSAPPDSPDRTVISTSMTAFHLLVQMERHAWMVLIPLSVSVFLDSSDRDAKNLWIIVWLNPVLMEQLVQTSSMTTNAAANRDFQERTVRRTSMSVAATLVRTEVLALTESMVLCALALLNSAGPSARTAAQLATSPDKCSPTKTLA